MKENKDKDAHTKTDGYLEQERAHGWSDSDLSPGA